MHFSNDQKCTTRRAIEEWDGCVGMNGRKIFRTRWEQRTAVCFVVASTHEWEWIEHTRRNTFKQSKFSSLWGSFLPPNEFVTNNKTENKIQQRQQSEKPLTNGTVNRKCHVETKANNSRGWLLFSAKNILLGKCWYTELLVEIEWFRSKLWMKNELKVWST